MRAAFWIVLACFALFVASLFVERHIESSYAQSKPRTPNAEQTISLSVTHGYVIYVSENELNLYNERKKWTHIVTALSLVTVVLIGIFGPRRKGSS